MAASRNGWMVGAALAVGVGAVTPAADAAFTGYSVVTTVEGNYRRHVLYANFSGANDCVLNAFHCNKTVGGGSPVFHHADAISGGIDSTVAGTWNPQFVLAPGAMDSYVCIGGGEGFASGNSTNADPDWGGAGFNQAQVPFLAAGTSTAGPGWFNGNPPNKQGLQSNGKVKLGQFIMAVGDAPVTLFLKVGFNTGAGTTVQFAEGVLTLPCGADCNSNAVCDGAELEQNPALDCNGNGNIDSCEISQNPSIDCDGNGKIDSCELAQNPTLDCNGNGKIDSCDIAQDPALDCDQDGILNSCELASGAAFDCDADGIPDNCEITSGSGFDCNGNGALDSCEIASGAGFDCNGNATLDSCEIAAGLADCDSDGRPDVCEGGLRYSQVRSGAIASTAPLEVSFAQLLPAYAGTPRLEIRATADLGAPTDGIVVTLDGGTGTSIFVADGTDCPATPNLATITRDRPTFNALVADGQLLVRLTAFGGVNTANCANGSVSVTLIYDALPATSDCNGNLLLDSCEIGTGAQPDCNSNGIVDACELASGSQTDCNGNGRLDSCDLALGSSTDLDGNGRLDDCLGEFIVGGSGFSTIAAAIASAPEGAVIRVGPGVYGGFSMADRSLSIVSLAGAGQSFIEGGGGRAIDIARQGAAPILIEGFTIQNSTASSGAGLRAVDTAVVIRSCVFLANTATTGRGGGAQCIRSVAEFTDCVFSENSANQGGGLSVEGSAVDGDFVLLERTAFESNIALVFGGAILGTGPARMVNCIALANHAGGAGQISSAAVHIFTDDPFEIGESYFCGNSPTNVAGSYLDLGGNSLGSDCNLNGICDAEELVEGTAFDCDGDGLLDECAIAAGAPDCNQNGVLDSCELLSGGSNDVDSNGVPDECQPDCDGDEVPDPYEIDSGLELDCNGNNVPDPCDIAAGAGDDDGDGRLDLCEFALGDLDLNGIVNASDITILLVFWGAQDPAIDPNGDGVVNAQDLAILLDNWGIVG